MTPKKKKRLEKEGLYQKYVAWLRSLQQEAVMLLLLLATGAARTTNNKKLLSCFNSLDAHYFIF